MRLLVVLSAAVDASAVVGKPFAVEFAAVVALHMLAVVPVGMDWDWSN